MLYAYVRDAAQALGRTLKKGAFSHALRFFRWYLLHFHRNRFRYLLPFVPQLYPRAKWDPEILGGEKFEAIAHEKSADALFLKAANSSADRMREFLRALDGEPLPSAFSRHLLTGEQAET